jgi:hypothetical protein
MKKNSIITKRLTKYSNLKKNLVKNNISFRDFLFFFEISFDKNDRKLIRQKVKDYLIVSVNRFFKKKFKRNSKFDSFKKYLIDLPNITPNGVIKVKKENFKEYLIIQKYIYKILKKCGISNNINLMEFVEVRLMRSTKYKYNSKRPYSSSKIHSDSWSGNPCDAKLAFYILGDKDNTIQFYSPKKIDINFFKKKINYETAINKYGFKKIKKFNPNKLTIFDQSCLHKTLNFNKGLRVSIDFGIIVSKKTDISLFSKRYKDNFFSPDNKLKFVKTLKSKKLKSIFSKEY